MSKVALLLGILALMGSAMGQAKELSPTATEAELGEALGLPQGELVRDGRVYVMEGGVIYQVIQGRRFRPRCRDGELEALLPWVSLPGLFEPNAFKAREGYRPLLDRLGHALVRGGLKDHLLCLGGHATAPGPRATISDSPNKGRPG